MTQNNRTAVTTASNGGMVSANERALIFGDITGLDEQGRLEYLHAMCDATGLNPATKPFGYMSQWAPGGEKLVFYLTATGAAQLRLHHAISITKMVDDGVAHDGRGDCYRWTVYGRMANGREDVEIGSKPLYKGKEAIPLTGLEYENCRKAALCVPLNSEILTLDGFKRYDQVCIGDSVAAYNVATDTTVWTPLLNVTTYDSLPMARLYSDGGQFEVFCTPDHSWAVRHEYRFRGGTGQHKGPCGPKPRPLREMVEAHAIARRDAIILAAPEVGSVAEGDSLLLPVEAAILGWAVTDGTIKRVGNSVRIGIYQSKEHNFPAIRELVSVVSGGAAKEGVSAARERTFPISGKTYATKDGHWWYIPSAVSKAILERAGFHDRCDLPRIVTRLSGTARKAMLQAMMLAEGTDRGDFHNKDASILEAFQILCALEGSATGVPKQNTSNKVIRLKTTRHAGANCINFERIASAPAWCPTTAFGTWIMRQNGRVTITGNTQAKTRLTKSLTGLAGVLSEDEVDGITSAAAIATPKQIAAASVTLPRSTNTGPVSDLHWPLLLAVTQAWHARSGEALCVPDDDVVVAADMEDLISARMALMARSYDADDDRRVKVSASTGKVGTALAPYRDAGVHLAIPEKLSMAGAEWLLAFLGGVLASASEGADAVEARTRWRRQRRNWSQ